MARMTIRHSIEHGDKVANAIREFHGDDVSDMSYTFGNDVVIELQTDAPQLIAGMSIMRLTNARVSVTED